MDVLAVLATARDRAVLTLSFSAVHVGVNVLATANRPRCPYDEPIGLVFSTGVFLLFALALGAQAAAEHAAKHLEDGAPRWHRRCVIAALPYMPYVPLVRDALCIVPGVWYSITTKPAGWYAAVPVDGCDMRASGYAFGLWNLGEMLTFGSSLHLLWALGFGRSVLGTVRVVVLAVALQMATGLVARALSNVYGV